MVNKGHVEGTLVRNGTYTTLIFAWEATEKEKGLCTLGGHDIDVYENFMWSNLLFIRRLVV